MSQSLLIEVQKIYCNIHAPCADKLTDWTTVMNVLSMSVNLIYIHNFCNSNLSNAHIIPCKSNFTINTTCLNLLSPAPVLVATCKNGNVNLTINSNSPASIELLYRGGRESPRPSPWGPLWASLDDASSSDSSDDRIRRPWLYQSINQSLHHRFPQTLTDKPFLLCAHEPESLT